MIEFPISGVETYWWLPLLVAFLVAYASSLGGLSGAYMILPFQISILGFTGPAVTSTNLIFNIFATPGGVYRLFREGRMVWPLAWTLVAGTIPGVFIGSIVRVYFLLDPVVFKLFAGSVLLIIGGKLVHDGLTVKDKISNRNNSSFKVSQSRFTMKRVSFEFDNQEYGTSTLTLFALAFLVGVIGGTYGIGGGAILVPILVTFFRFPVYTISGAALLETFVTSLTGVISYSTIAYFKTGERLLIAPDWFLGGLLGLGGFIGIYLGARSQKYLPSRFIKLVISIGILFVAGKYILGFFI